MRPSAVLLDGDGCLFDSEQLWARATNAALKQHGCDPFHTIEDFQQTAHRTLQDMLRERYVDSPVIDRVWQARNDHIVALMETCSWCDGAEDFLALLKQERIPAALVTNAHGITVNVLDRVLGIREHVQMVVSGDDAHPDYKPHPKMVHIACERLGTDPKQSVLIGNMPSDMAAIEAAGGQGILVPSAFTPPNGKDARYRTCRSLRDIAKMLGLNGYSGHTVREE